MTEEPAEVINFLLEFVLRGIRIVTYLEKQRVAASFTDVLMVFVTLPKGDVVVTAEKARERMRDSGDPRTLLKNCCATSSARRARLARN